MPRNPERNAEFTRHVRRMRRQELFGALRPFAIAGVFVLAILGFLGWNTFSTVPCGEVTGVVERTRTEATPAGRHGVLMVAGDDAHNYYSEDPGDRAAPVGSHVALAVSCTHTGARRPMAHFDHWVDGATG